MNFQNLLHALNLEQKEFSFQFQSHPNYPSALAFSDTLNFMGIKNEAYNLEKKYWKELPEDFITVYNDNFALIKRINSSFKVFSDDEKYISEEELYHYSTNFVLLFEVEEKIKTNNKFSYKYVFFAVFASLLFYSLLFLTWYESIFNLLSLGGLYVSLELFNKKFGQESSILNNICSGGGATKPQENCSKIIDSDKINILGLKLSDFSLVYFIATLALGIFFPTATWIIKGLGFLSIFVIIYSLYMQVFVEKVICKVCLLIVSILIFQIILAGIYFPNTFQFNTLYSSILVFAFTFMVIVYINNELKQKEILSKSNLKNLRFKRNYELFKRELLDKEKIKFKDDFSGFFVGNNESKLHISLVSNPYCGFCKDAHEILEQLHKKYPKEISFQIRFNYLLETKDENLDLLMQNLFGIYSKNVNDFLNYLHFWFEERDVKKITNKYENSEIHDVNILQELTEDNFAKNLTFTPTFLINGYQFPDKYERDDIFYFIDELLDDDGILK